MAAGLSVRKRERMFARLDRDGDGVVDERDVHDHIDLLLTAFGIAVDAPEAVRFHSWGDRLWEALSRAEAGGRRLITRAGYVDLIDGQLVEQVYVPMNRTLFAIADADGDGDGFVTRAELAAALGIDGMSDPDLHAALHRLDRDGDGRISRTDLDQATRELFLSEDPEAVGNLLLGSS
ncbi:EF-hand domain-containing protein [Saccharothrix syringae]|nr:EF-hand domain-containing protein [Saccharothrix syringae]